MNKGLLEKLKKYFPDLYHWITSTLGSHKLAELVHVDSVDEDYCMFAFQTVTHKYQISALKPGVEILEGSLGGEVMTEPTGGSNDIGGGPYTYLTWVDILKDIVRYELISI
ncbi:hypothetical protein LCGC14_1236940 [marine sediment metagenome]|uniref:Uncharacterized protein n=1 Tax=marine sediment metagenome TaxID=412755 RepID=A0A0F9KEG4_9ZZZZ|nr:MAG: hypothetical protein Lokiarch_14430 [Candidatus Lokiarchaeum sp. GC14_75]